MTVCLHKRAVCLHERGSVGCWGRMFKTVLFNWPCVAERRSWLTSAVVDGSFFVWFGSAPDLLSLVQSNYHVLYRDCSGFSSGSVGVLTVGCLSISSIYENGGNLSVLSLDGRVQFTAEFGDGFGCSDNFYEGFWVCLGSVELFRSSSGLCCFIKACCPCCRTKAGHDCFPCCRAKARFSQPFEVTGRRILLRLSISSESMSCNVAK